MKFVQIVIERFTAPSQPGFVECSLIDAWDKTHLFEDKVPIFTNQYLDEDSSYPQTGCIACEILKCWTDAHSRQIITITTQRPWSVDSKEGVFEFDLLREQLTDSEV